MKYVSMIFAPQYIECKMYEKYKKNMQVTFMLKKKESLFRKFFFLFGFFWGQNLSMWLKWKKKLSFVLGVKSVAIWTLENLFFFIKFYELYKKKKKKVIVVQLFKLNSFILLWENCLFVKILPSLVNVTFLKIVVIVLWFG